MCPQHRNNMADINSSDQALNGLKIKSDALPGDWMVTLVNPKNEEPGENMTIARFTELFISNNKIWTENNDGYNSNLDAGLFAGKDENGYISFKGTSVNLDTINTNSFTIYNGNTTVGKPSGYGLVLTLTNSDKAETPGKSGFWINQLAFGTNKTLYFRQRIDTAEWTSWMTISFSLSNSYSLTSNALTETIVENIPVSNNTPMTQEEVRQLTLETQSFERYEYSIPKMAEMILSLRKELNELKGGVGEE